MNLRHSNVIFHKPHPVDSAENLRSRVDRLLAGAANPSETQGQASFELSGELRPELQLEHPSKTIVSLLDFLSDVVPDGDVYLFGGVLRDMALLGRRGFNSDIDVVVEGSWEFCLPYLEKQGAIRNKFGGLRLSIDGWPIDIWKASETWAFTQGLVQYRGIGSLTDTTVLNWDAILMNWRTRFFVHRANYFEDIRERVLSVVLQENPNPMGMAVRVFRHLALKDAKKITASAADYLASVAKTYSFDQLRRREVLSYGNTVIEPRVYKFFEIYAESDGVDSHSRMGVASDILLQELRLSGE